MILSEPLNTLFVTLPGAYLAKDHENLVVKVDQVERVRVPLHHVGSVVLFGCVFRRSWPPIPAESGHPFRRKLATPVSGAGRRRDRWSFRAFGAAGQARRATNGVCGGAAFWGWRPKTKRVEGSACGKPGSFPVFHRRRSLPQRYEQGVDVGLRPGSGACNLGELHCSSRARRVHGIATRLDHARPADKSDRPIKQTARGLPEDRCVDPGASSGVVSAALRPGPGVFSSSRR